MLATQCFRVLVEPDLNAVIWVLHPFAAKGLRAQCIIMRDIEESGLSITAYFVGLEDSEALALVGTLLKTPQVRSATVETIVAPTKS